jgi:hypothetical protein
MLRRMNLPNALKRAYVSVVRDAFLLEKAERLAAGYPTSTQERMRELFKAGVRWMNAASDLSDGHPVAASILYRHAATALIGAILASRGETIELDSRDAAPAFDRLDGLHVELPDAPRGLEETRRLLTSRDPLIFDRLGNDARSELEVIASVVPWLCNGIEPRTVRRIRTIRMLRLGMVAMAVLALLIWSALKLMAPKNIALHKPTMASSVHPYSTAPEGGLTDGNTSGPYGVHTNVEANPWVRVDLQDIYRLDKVKVYNRNDGYYDEGLPFTLELSVDGTDFAAVDRKEGSFDKSSPWVYAAKGRRVRYIQVRGNPGKYVTLSEIEAYGGK